MEKPFAEYIEKLKNTLTDEEKDAWIEQMQNEIKQLDESIASVKRIGDNIRARSRALDVNDRNIKPK
jgi:hypothetical protein